MMELTIDEEDNERLAKYEEVWKSIFKLKNAQFEVYEKIINETLRELPVGYISDHTAENIPETVKGWVERAIDAENELEELRDKFKVEYDDLVNQIHLLSKELDKAQSKAETLEEENEHLKHETQSNE